MNLYFDPAQAVDYKSSAQIVRILSEHWLKTNISCINCGSALQKTENNSRVKDFICPHCQENYELKSKKGLSIGTKMPDGAYNTMLARIQAEDNPNFFFLAYERNNYRVQQLVLVPKHFVTVNMIAPRRNTLKGRDNYLMCDLDIRDLPEGGKIPLITAGKAIDPTRVQKQWQAHLFLRQQKAEKKGWLLAILHCLDQLPAQFNLAQLYAFSDKLQKQFLDNHHIQAKIRQQLQILRDQNLIEFGARGQYRKIV